MTDNTTIILFSNRQGDVIRKELCFYDVCDLFEFIDSFLAICESLHFAASVIDPLYGRFSTQQV